MTLHGRVTQNLNQKLTGGLKNDMKNLLNFHASSRKSEHLFDGLVLSKPYKALSEKVQK